MNNCRLLCALGWVCLAGLSAAGHAATSTTPAPTSAASAPPVRPGQRERPVQSPAVSAAQSATTPGDLRPENPVVPQLAVPLRRDRSATGSDRVGSAAVGEIDDTAARCRAATSDRERAACTRGGTVPGAPKR